MSHPNHDLFENRKLFQLERLILFSDAVFAIAITLLIIEIKVPELHEVSTQTIKQALAEKFPEFFGFVLSFAVVGLFWSTHHRLFGYVSSYDNGLLWLNLLCLFWIVIVPFTSALNSRYGGYNFVWICYSVNMFMIAISLYFMWRYIGNPKRNLSPLAHDERLRKMSRVRSLTMALIFLSGGLVCLFNTDTTTVIARCMYILMLPAMFLISKKYAPKK